MPNDNLTIHTMGVGAVPRTKEDDLRRARLTVADRATSADDCRQLLDMLGLLPGQTNPLDTDTE